MPMGIGNIEHTDRPDLIREVYGVVLEEMGNDGFFEVSHREIAFGVNGMSRYQLLQAPACFTPHLVAILTELYGYFPGSKIREFYMPVVNTPHQFLLLRDRLFIRQNRQVAEPGAVYAQ